MLRTCVSSVETKSVNLELLSLNLCRSTPTTWRVTCEYIVYCTYCIFHSDRIDDDGGGGGDGRDYGYDDDDNDDDDNDRVADVNFSHDWNDDVDETSTLEE